MESNQSEISVNKNEQIKRNRFINLGEKRMNNALKSIRHQNLSNKHNYSYDSRISN